MLNIQNADVLKSSQYTFKTCVFHEGCVDDKCCESHYDRIIIFMIDYKFNDVNEAFGAEKNNLKKLQVCP